MRITSCHIAGFGQFENRSLEGLDRPLVVVLGPNEAGKSTLFQFLVTMFYGFKPADARNHPYCPVGGGPMGGHMEFVAGTSTGRVERKLKSAPSGVLTVGEQGLFGATHSLRNQSLSLTGEVTRELFEAVHALSLADMARVPERAWDSIQDRLLGGLNAEDLRAGREVAADLEARAKRLWRSDRRGRTRAQEFREKLRELREEVREARRLDATAREISLEREKTAARIAALDERAAVVRGLRSSVQRLIPVKAGLERLERYRAEAGDVSELECLPADPRETLEMLERDLADLEAEESRVLAILKAAGEAVARFGTEERVLTDLAPEIRTWHSKLALFEQRRRLMEEAEVTIGRLEARKADLASRLFGSAPTTESLGTVRGLATAELREALRRYTARRDALRVSRAREEGRRTGVAVGGVWLWVVVVVLAVGLVAVGATIGQPVVWGPAAVLMVLAAALAVQTLMASRNEVVEGDEGSGRTLEPELRTVRQLLGDLPLADARLEDPSGELAGDLGELQKLLVEIDIERATAADLAGRQAEDERAVRDLLARIGVEPGTSPEGDLDGLFVRLREVEAIRMKAVEADEMLSEHQSRLDLLRERKKRTGDRRATLVTRLMQIGGGDRARGLELAVERQKAAAALATTAAELEAQYSDLDRLRQEVEGWTGEVSIAQETLDELERELEDLSRARRQHGEELATHDARLQNLLEGQTVAEVESKVAWVEDELRGVRRERDRLMLLAGVVRHADAVFRERHQPDVIRRASDLIQRLTHGRYSHLEVGEDDGALSIRDAAYDRRVGVAPPLSRGTLDQIYLSLRLGLVDHLDSSGERLPLFLDEILVNWDADRRKSVLEVLQGLGETRQVFLFTCHDWLAEEIERRAGGHIIGL